MSLTDELPDAAWATALAGLPRMGPRRLDALLQIGSASAAWEAVWQGRAADLPAVAAALGPEAADLPRRWALAARALDVERVWSEHLEAGVRVLTAADDDYPAVFRTDVEPPPVLFCLGSLDVLDGPRAAVVGTRRCTRYGRDVAYDLGRDLAAAGVRVVSGLALGIDGAAHEGALAADGAGPIAVLGNGLDVFYPSRHRELQERVAERGLLLSEHPLGTKPKAWTFPARNRLVASLGDVLVVVESHRKGGSVYTVDEAERRGRGILAVPGSVRSPASEGTNHLLHAGKGPARDALDVLAELALDSQVWRRADPRPRPDRSGSEVLESVGWEPVTLEDLVESLSMPLAEVMRHLEALEEAGWVVRRGGWVERISSPGSAGWRS